MILSYRFLNDEPVRRGEMEVVWIIYICVMASAVIAVLYLYAFRYEPFNFKLSDVDIFVKDKLTDKTGVNRPAKPILTILHLSDFHLRENSKGKRLFKFVRSLSRLNVDFILITGDLLESDKNIGYLVEMLSPLRAKYGKYAVFGVHDHYYKTVAEFLKNIFKKKRKYKKENDVSYIIKKLNDIGIEVLVNQVRKISIKGSDVSNVEIIGLDDPIIKKTDIAKAFSYIGPIKKLKPLKKSDYLKEYRDTFKLRESKIHKLNNDGVLRIILLHTPDSGSIIDLAANGSDIILSGHTHGGQVRLPLIGAIISGCNIKTKFASGLFYFKKFVLYVSRGLGEGRYSQFRFYCQPEASLIRIYNMK
jgi:predicted MPP superfamily phosphohydrolase